MASQLAIHRSILSNDVSASRSGGNVRVVIRLEKVRQNLRRQLGTRPTDADVISWLGTLGFVPATDGNAWTCSQDSLRWLAEGEIARTEQTDRWDPPLHSPSVDAAAVAPVAADTTDAADLGIVHYLRSRLHELNGRLHTAVERFLRTFPLS